MTYSQGPSISDPLSSFLQEVKAIEKTDSALTSPIQITRLLRPGSSYANLNPFDVLILESNATDDEVKKMYRKMSILLHPDKNNDDRERAQAAFDIVNKAYKALMDKDMKAKALEVVEEATFKVNQSFDEKRKAARKSGLKPEDTDPMVYKEEIKKMTTKLFAEYERKRKQNEDRAQEDRKRKREKEIEEEEGKRTSKEWNQNYEESRETRVNNWQTFQKNKKAKTKGNFKPPKHKPLPP